MKQSTQIPFIFAAISILIFLSGCIPDETTIQVKVFVHDRDNAPVKGASVNAYDRYSFNSADPMEKWLTLTNANIVSSREVNGSGIALMNLSRGKYAFFAKAPDGRYGGTEQYVSSDGERVDITVSPLPMTPV